MRAKCEGVGRKSRLKKRLARRRLQSRLRNECRGQVLEARWAARGGWAVTVTPSRLVLDSNYPMTKGVIS
eukprot:7327145-Pyramimonas_sp.AAC.1